jgi:hypothetical protein
LYGVEVVDSKLSTPSLGITVRLPAEQVIHLAFLLTPSLGITHHRDGSCGPPRAFQLPLSGSRQGLFAGQDLRRTRTFNSLSRDHSPASGRTGDPSRVPFNSLSRDHRPSASADTASGAATLSTPSLGITDELAWEIANAVANLSTPSLGITSLSPSCMATARNL